MFYYLALPLTIGRESNGSYSSQIFWVGLLWEMCKAQE